MYSLVEVSPLFLPCVKAKLSKSGASAHALAPAAKQSPLPFIFPSLNFEPAWKSTSGNGMGGAEGAPGHPLRYPPPGCDSGDLARPTAGISDRFKKAWLDCIAGCSGSIHCCV